MQLMTFNSLLMFDIVFVFFLFLVGVTCLVYYLPPSRSSTAIACRHHPRHTQHTYTHNNGDDNNSATHPPAHHHHPHAEHTFRHSNSAGNISCQYYRHMQKQQQRHQRQCQEQQFVLEQESLHRQQQLRRQEQQQQLQEQQQQQLQEQQQQGHILHNVEQEGYRVEEEQPSHCCECIKRAALLSEHNGVVVENGGNVYCQLYDDAIIVPDEANHCGRNGGGGGGVDGELQAVLVEDVDCVEYFTTETTSYYGDIEKAAAVPQCCYVNAKQYDIKECTGPIDTV